MTKKIWVKESAFGIWFLNTDIWLSRVLTKALNDLQRMLPETKNHYTAILDIGCGRGQSLQLLDEYFNPDTINGIEIDESLLNEARKRAKKCRGRVDLITGNAEIMPYPDQSFDMVFCHQSFHHIVQHEKAMQEFYRVLKPGGVLLFAESCKKFIHSLSIRLLFRHPMDVQKTADEYIHLINQTGFHVHPDAISKPYLWWSRPDLGAIEWFGFKAPEIREETMVNLVAVKMQADQVLQ
ncbi:MAG: class I SAM-dependent methyltransferase [Methylococcales bacterium]|nr:class I SAM-dependent methyltransferase [Methylococcales bacterium]